MPRPETTWTRDGLTTVPVPAVLDTMLGTGLLSARNGEYGMPWTRVQGTADVNIAVVGGEAKLNGNGFAVYAPAGPVGQVNYTATVKFRRVDQVTAPGDATNMLVVTVCRPGSALSGYQMGVFSDGSGSGSDRSSCNIHLWRVTNGAFDGGLGGDVRTLANGDEQELSVQVNGSEFTVRLNGVALFTGEDALYAGETGVWLELHDARTEEGAMFRVREFRVETSPPTEAVATRPTSEWSA